MMDQLTYAKSNTFIGAILALMIVLSVGCASQDAAVSGSNEPSQIVDIIIHEDHKSLILSIRGNQTLTPTEDRQIEPKKIELYFPATGLDSVRGRFVPPDNEIISSIIIIEDDENETINSTIYIALKVDSPYTVTPDKDGLLITFNKTPALPEKNIPQTPPAEKNLEPQLAKPAQKSLPIATVLRRVTAESLENAVEVNVQADGPIKEYKAFTVVNPDRIVFDLYNIKSPQQQEQKIAVQSKWIKRIRYYGHPDKLRLVIETHREYLSQYSSSPTDTGLIIHVGSK